MNFAYLAYFGNNLVSADFINSQNAYFSFALFK